MADQGLFIRLRIQPASSHLAALHSLLAAGWDPNDHGILRYLPIGDDDDFDWNSTPICDLSSVMAEVEAKVKNGEMVGIVLMFENTLVGGEWLFFPNGDVTFSPSVNRRVVDGHSDVEWYLHRILPALARSEAIKVESWRWEESP